MYHFQDKIHTYFFNTELVPRIYSLQRKKSAKNKYWFLYAIGPIFYDTGKLKCKFYFLNKEFPDDIFIDCSQGKKKSVVLDAAMITFFAVGSIFDELGFLKYKAANYKAREGCLEVKIANKLHYCNDELKFLNSRKNKFPILTPECLKGFTYYKIESIKDCKNVTVIIPVYVLIRYLFFKSSFLAQKIIDSTLFDSIEYLPPIKSETSQKVIGKVRFDNSQYSVDDILRIASYIFMKNDLGLKALKSIGSNVKKKILNNSNLSGNSCYLQFDYPFCSPVTLNMTGKQISYKNEEYFLVYDIENLRLHNKKTFTVDRIIIYPLFLDKLDPTQIFKRRSAIAESYIDQKGQKKTHTRINDYSTSFFPPLDFGLDLACCNEIESYYWKKFENKYSLYHYYIDFCKNRTIIHSYIIQVLTQLSEERENYTSYIYFDGYVSKNLHTRIKVCDVYYDALIVQIYWKGRFVYYIDTGGRIWLVSKEIDCKPIYNIDLKLIINRLIMYFSSDNNEFYDKVWDYKYFNENFGLKVKRFKLPVYYRYLKDRRNLEYETDNLKSQLNEFVA